MKSIFFAASYQKKEEFRVIYDVLRKSDFLVSSPIFDYQPTEKLNYKQLMQHSFEKIIESDIFLADVTYKEIGIGVEAGYAKAHSKPIIYIRKDGSDLSTTIWGISTNMLNYQDGQYSEILRICNSVQL